MSLEITLVRHAESQANLDTHLIGGYQPSISLSPIGIFQAEALGKKWHTEGVEFDAVWSSDAVRTKQTAQYAIYRILQTK